MSKHIGITPEKAAEFLKWRKNNNASYAQTGEQFGIPGHNIVYWSKRMAKLGKVKTIKTRRYTKKSAPTESFVLAIPEAPQNVAVIVMPLKNVKSFVEAMSWQ